MKTAAILLAGGMGTRFSHTTPKQFISLCGKPLAMYSYEIFAQHPAIHELIVVAHPEFRSYFGSCKFAMPGNRRQDSVYNGLLMVSQDCDMVCIHDAARPFVKASLVQSVIDEACKHGAACAAVPMKNTVKQSYGEQFVVQTLDRSTLWEVQTPQVIRKMVLIEGFKIAHQQGLTVTDDVSLVELQQKKVKLVKSVYENIKITTPDDLIVAEQLLSR